MNRLSQLIHNKKFKNFLILILISAAITIADYCLNWNLFINTADEGFVWYGAERTALGDIPMLDFRGYVPGRYYLLGFWLKLLGSGLANFRITTHIYQFIGILLTLLIVNRYTKKYWILTLIGIFITVWIWPYFRVLDTIMYLAVLYPMTLLIENPTIKRYFLTGLVIGFSGFVGRHIGFYCLLSFLLMNIFLLTKKVPIKILKSGASSIAGIVLGFSPMLFMMFFINGFWESFWDAMSFIVSEKTVNIARPVPWPWDYTGTSLINFISYIPLGFLFIFMPIVLGGLFLYLFFLKKDQITKYAGLAASIFIGLPWIHYAFSRADLSHIARGMPALIIAATIFFLIKNKTKTTKWISSLTLALAVLFTGSIMALNYPFSLKTLLPANTISSVEVNGDTFWVWNSVADTINKTQAIGGLIDDNEELLILPHQATLYPILERKSPIRDTYLLLPQSEEKQYRYIEESQNVEWVLLCHTTVDNREDLLFSNTNPIFYQYIIDNFETVNSVEAPNQCELLKRTHE